MVDSSPVGSTTLVFLHLPKTGGRTLRTVMRRQFDSERVFEAYSPTVSQAIQRYERLSDEEKLHYRVIIGHVPITLHQSIPGGCRYVTMLRHPVRRVLSDYFYMRRTPAHPRHDLIRDGKMSLEDAMESGAFPMFENGQARVLANYWEAYGECPPETVEHAMDNLDRHSAIVGLTERYDESLLLMGRELGWSWSKLLYAKRNVSRDRPRIEDLPQRTVSLIEEFNQMDLELYRRVENRFSKQVAETRSTMAVELAAFRLANRAFNRYRGLRAGAGRLLPGSRNRTVA